MCTRLATEGIEGFLTEVVLSFQCNNALLLFSRSSGCIRTLSVGQLQVPEVALVEHFFLLAVPSDCAVPRTL